jgi:hypothetical protein
MTTIVRSAVLIALVSTPVVAVLQDGPQAIEPAMAQAFGKKLADEAAKIQKPQVKVTADSEKANGVHMPHKAGTLVVPEKDLMEGAELAAKFKEEKGTPIAYLFLYHLSPVINGAPADASRLYTVKLTNDEGAEQPIQVLLLAVRQLAEDDYRLYGYGHQDKPLVDAKFAEGTGPGAEPVAVELKDLNEQTKQGKLVVTVFGKYQASFTVGYRAE